MNPREQLVDRLMSEGKSDDEILSALKEFDATAPRPRQSPGLPSAAPVDRLDQTERNPQATNPVADMAILGASGATLGLSDRLVGRDRANLARRNMGPMDAAAGMFTVGPLAAAGKAIAGAKVLSGGNKASKIVRGVVNAATGNMPTTALPKGEGFVRNLFNSAKNVRNTAATGAAQGAIYGANTNEDAGAGAVQGAIFGGLAGGAISGTLELAKAGQKLVQTISSRIPGVDRWAVQRAYDDLAEMAVSENLTPEQFVERAKQLPQGDLISDALKGRYTRGRVLGALDDTSERGVRQQGAGLRDDVQARASNAGSVRDAFLETAGVDPNIPPVQQRAGIRATTKVKAEKEYKDLYAAFPDELDDPVLTEIMSARGKDGGHLPVLARAEEIAERRLRALREGGPASFTTRNTPIRNIQFYDEVKKALGEMGSGGDIMARQLEKELVARLDDLTQGRFAQTRAVVQEGRTQETASRLGEKGATSSDARTQQFMVEQELKKRGVTPEMAGKVRAAGKEGGLLRVAGMDEGQIRQMLKDGKRQRFLMENMDNYPAFEARAKDILRKEIDAIELRTGEPVVTSQGKRVLDADVFGALTPWDIASAIRGNPALGLAHIGAAAEGKFIRGRNARTNEALLTMARRSARTDRGELDPAFEAIARSMTAKMAPKTARTSTTIPRAAGLAARFPRRSQRDE